MENDKLELGDVYFYNIFDLDEEYIERLRYWRNQDFVRENMFNQHIISEDEHNEFISKLKDNKLKRFYICFMGIKPFGVLYYEYLSNSNNLEFGYYLIDKNYINSGLGIVMEYAILNHAFYKLNVDKVYCRTFVKNNKVVSLHNNFGFLTEKIVKYYIKDNESYLDVAVQAIDKRNWENNKKSIEKYIKVLLGGNIVNEIESGV
ncbi:UDP-4-amino-4,6-dideoxy-N-acetyl-beta-L-altrosamine N-acetyltransferase [Acetivibrio clariflavus]|nr:UDP-4-amino-4,6-dideoxy-N-acetyl-beta-L-altrosamine N-acetyltransferase [Acetivibrio clariflavus]